MTQLANILSSLGLEQYHDALTREGFDTWDTVQDITEQDLEALNVKLGHRRKLQRFIASQRGINVDQPLSSSFPDPTADRGPESGAPASGDNHGERGGLGSETKRKYKRHPKPDENAPERPPSAYVLFSNAIREEIKGQDLSFTDIAKLVGQRWQSLTAAEREPYETRAANLKEAFNQELAEYKKTEQYREYSQYLAEFKAKHGGSSAEGKRPKLEEEYSAGSMGSPSTPTMASSKSPRIVEPLAGVPGSGHGRTAQGVSIPRVGSSGPESSPIAGQQAQNSLSGGRSYTGSAIVDSLQLGRSQEINRPSPRIGPSAIPGDTPGYFDHPSRHGVREGTASQPGGTGSAGPFESGLFSRPPAKPQLFHQDTVISSASSVPSNLSYGSASTAPLQTPMTPRDDPWSSRPLPHDTYKPSTSWDVPRPVHPPFASPHGTPFSAVNTLKGPERPYSHHSEPTIRLPPPNVTLAQPPLESPALSLRGTTRPALPFADQRPSSISRNEPLQGVQRSEKEGGSPLDLLAQAVDARESRPERRPP